MLKQVWAITCISGSVAAMSREKPFGSSEQHDISTAMMSLLKLEVSITFWDCLKTPKTARPFSAGPLKRDLIKMPENPQRAALDSLAASISVLDRSLLPSNKISCSVLPQSA